MTEAEVQAKAGRWDRVAMCQQAALTISRTPMATIMRPWWTPSSATRQGCIDRV